MGIELGSTGSALGNIAGSLGSLGRAGVGVAEGAVGTAPAMVGLGGSLGRGLEFGPKMGLADISPIVNEGPVGLSDLQTTVPWQANVDVVSQAETVAAKTWNSFIVPDVITEAEIVLSEAQKPAIVSPAALGEFSPVEWAGKGKGWGSGEDRNWDSKKAELVIAPQVELQTASGAVDEVKQATVAQPVLQEQEVEEVVTERVTSEQEDVIKEEEIVKKKKFVVDKPTLAHRLQEIGQAVHQAKPEAERLGLGKKIIGWLVERFLSLSHSGDISQLVQPEGPDGTIPLTREEIRAKGEFESEEQVQTVVLNNRPVSEEGDGELASDEEVRKVLQDRIVKPNKPNQPLNIVEKRITQKEQKLFRQRPVLTLVSKQPEAKKENNLRDLGLEEVFPKAA